MGAISQDLSAAGMAAAIEASWIGVLEFWSRSSRVDQHDDKPDLRWYATTGVPVPLFNHAYLTRLAKEEDIDARIKALGGISPDEYERRCLNREEERIDTIEATRAA